MTHEETAVKATYFSIAGNSSLALIKGLAGYFGNSYALIADAIESTTDIFASFLVLFGIKYSNKPADKNHPYGHGRAHVLKDTLRSEIIELGHVLIHIEPNE